MIEPDDDAWVETHSCGGVLTILNIMMHSRLMQAAVVEVNLSA